jgi:hypothetical protein
VKITPEKIGADLLAVGKAILAHPYDVRVAAERHQKLTADLIALWAPLAPVEPEPNLELWDLGAGGGTWADKAMHAVTESGGVIFSKHIFGGEGACLSNDGYSGGTKPAVQLVVANCVLAPSPTHGTKWGARLFRCELRMEGSFVEDMGKGGPNEGHALYLNPTGAVWLSSSTFRRCQGNALQLARRNVSMPGQSVEDGTGATSVVVDGLTLEDFHDPKFKTERAGGLFSIYDQDAAIVDIGNVRVLESKWPAYGLLNVAAFYPGGASCASLFLHDVELALLSPTQPLVWCGHVAHVVKLQRLHGTIAGDASKCAIHVQPKGWVGVKPKRLILSECAIEPSLPVYVQGELIGTTADTIDRVL